MGKYKKKKGYKRKTYRKKGYKNRITAVSNLAPIAPRYVTKMKYMETIATDGSFRDYVWLLNGLFDPNFTGSGHQPLGYDQLAVLYNRYRVTKVSYTIRAVCTESTGVYNVAIYPSNQTDGFSTMSQIMEQPRARAGIVVLNKPLTFKGSLDLAKVVGVKKEVYMADDRFQSQNGTVPAESISLHTYVSNLTGGTAGSGSVTLNVHLTFHCEWYDTNQLSQS